MLAIMKYIAMFMVWFTVFCVCCYILFLLFGLSIIGFEFLEVMEAAGLLNDN